MMRCFKHALPLLRNTPLKVCLSGLSIITAVLVCANYYNYHRTTRGPSYMGVKGIKTGFNVEHQRSTESVVNCTFSSPFPENVLDRRTHFSYDNGDILVHLHIPRTGGSNWGEHLLSIIQEKIGKDGSKSLVPLLEGWLFSSGVFRKIQWPCGTHPGLYELKNCQIPEYMEKIKGRPLTPTSRLLYFTMFREPKERLLSEWRFVKRTKKSWPRAKLHCNHPRDAISGRRIKPACILRENYRMMGDIDLDTFLNCENNYAINRQVSMMADYNVTVCPPLLNHGGYLAINQNQHVRWRTILANAKENLKTLVFFGLTEHQETSAELFEWTFGFRFSHKPSTRNLSPSASNNSREQDEKLELVTDYESDLYEYAEHLFTERLKYMQVQKRCGKNTAFIHRGNVS